MQGLSWPTRCQWQKWKRPDAKDWWNFGESEGSVYSTALDLKKGNMRYQFRSQVTRYWWIQFSMVCCGAWSWCAMTISCWIPGVKKTTFLMWKDVLDPVKAASLRMNRKKLQFLVDEVASLGFKVSSGCTVTDSAKRLHPCSANKKSFSYF